jgi:hypothetical protein
MNHVITTLGLVAGVGYAVVALVSLAGNGLVVTLAATAFSLTSFVAGLVGAKE